MTIIKLEPSDATVVISGFKVNAEDIHPSILRGMIPVSTPAFIDIEGEVKQCKTLDITLDGDINEVEAMKLHLIYTIVQEAINKQWKYLHSITLAGDLSNPKVIRSIVRGA